MESTNPFKGEYRFTLVASDISEEFRGSSRLEHFYGKINFYKYPSQMNFGLPTGTDIGFNPDKHQLLDCIEEYCLYDEYRTVDTRFTQLPDIFIMQMKFYKYDFKKDEMTTVSTT